MAFDFSLLLSFLALLTTFYQAHLQRVHNQKSVKPLPQVDLMDRNGLLFVHVQNNGVGPIVVESLKFTREGKSYNRIQDCLDIDPKKYHHIEVTGTNKKVINPGGFLLVFSEQLDPNDDQELIGEFRQQLSLIILEVAGRDIYDNRISINKSLAWFARHNTADQG